MISIPVLMLHVRSISLMLLVVGFYTATGDVNVVQISSGEEFVRAVLRFGEQGGPTILAINPVEPISLVNVSWDVPDSTAAFPHGPLTIQAHASGPGIMATLNTAMKSSLTPILRDTSVTWEGLIVTNLCSRLLQWNPVENFHVLIADAFYLMPRSRSIQNYERRDSIVYLSHQEFVGAIYLMILDFVPFAKIKENWASTIFQFAPRTLASVKAMDDYSISLDYFETSGSLQLDVTFRSTSNPADPLNLKLPEVGGSLMPHRMCADDGSDKGRKLVYAEYAQANFTLFPIWIVSSTPQLHSSLEIASRQSSSVITVRDEVRPLLILLIIRDVSLSGSSRRTPSNSFHSSNLTIFHSDVLMRGPLTTERTTLNLEDVSGAIKLDAPASLFIDNLVLSGLRRITLNHGSGSFDTSLRLSAFSLPDSEVVHLSNVTLLVPKQDFIALLSAAFRGSRWQSGASSSANVIRQISVFKPTQFDRGSLLLSEYKGWNVEGIDVIFMPNTPLLPSDELLDQAANGSIADKVALGVGIGGGVLLIGALLAVAARYKQQKARAHGEISPGSKEQNQSKGACKAANQGAVPAQTSEFSRTSKTGSVTVEMLPDVISIGPTKLTDKIAADQAAADLEAPLDPNALVRQQAAQLVKPNSDDVLQIKQTLGKGAWGTVYEGTWKGLKVAVKTVLFSEHTGSISKMPEKARAIMEAAVSTSISHRNVVSTYDYDILPVFHVDSQGLQVAKSESAAEDWKLILVLEYCSSTLGQALQSGILHRGLKPRWDRIIQLLLDVAQGSLYLHSLQIIHGDLKPENILIKADPDATIGMVAKLTDFGLAISLGPTATHASDFRLGTPFYCAPEVTKQGKTTKASDVYSFGVVMCEVCSKTAPWTKQGNSFIANMWFPKFAPDTPTLFQQLGLRCLALDMHDRPNFEEIVASLQSLMKDIR